MSDRAQIAPHFQGIPPQEVEVATLWKATELVVVTNTRWHVTMMPGDTLVWTVKAAGPGVRPYPSDGLVQVTIEDLQREIRDLERMVHEAEMVRPLHQLLRQRWRARQAKMREQSRRSLMRRLGREGDD